MSDSKFDFHAIVSDALADISDDKLRTHVENAVTFTRKREPVLRVNSSRSSSRETCRQCGVGIRKETQPVNGMHPKCAKVADDASYALRMGANTHAARSVHDAKIIPTLSRERQEREAREHAELLARLEAEALAEENKSA